MGMKNYFSKTLVILLSVLGLFAGASILVASIIILSTQWMTGPFFTGSI